MAGLDRFGARVITAIGPALSNGGAARLRAPLGALERFAYRSGGDRDERFDFLRGFAVFAMVVDHLAGPSRLYLLTGGNRFFTSAAEGFVFISGLIVGLVYRRMAARLGAGTAMRRLLGRAWQLYVLAVGMTLVMLTASELLDLPWSQGIDLRDAFAVVWSVLTLHQTYYLVDIPLLYALLMGLAPAAFFLLLEGRTWVVLGVTWAVWAGYQVYPDRTELPWTIGGNYLFYFPAWQVLFFTGMVLGFHRDRVAAAVTPRWQRVLLVLTALGFVVLLLVYRATDAMLRAMEAGQVPQGGRSFTADTIDLLWAKGDVRPGRIVASAVVFGFIFLCTTSFWTPLRRALGWLLLPLGRNALYAYSAHVAVALGLGILAVTSGRGESGSLERNTLVQLAGLALIWLAIRFRVLYPTPATRGRWMAAVAPLAVVALVAIRLDPSPEIPGLAAPAPTPPPAVKPQAVRRFGTPLPRATPRPADSSTAPASAAAPAAISAAATPVPPPAPEPPPVQANPLPAPAPALQTSGLMVAGVPRVSEYVGRIRGSFREVPFYSASLDRDTSYFAYLPPGYGTEGRRYPVLYMLHGGSGDKEEWLAYGLVDAVDRLIDSKELRPLIVVLPQGDSSYWVNHADDGSLWGDYVWQDLVHQVDSTFRTLPDAQHRAIGGLSMGGFGALVQAFTHPDVFGGVGAHSPSLHSPADGEAFLGAGSEFAERDPVELAQTAPDLESLEIWIDIGDQDPWVFRTELLDQALTERGIPHNFEEPAGEHDGTYWESNLVRYLRFYDEVLHWHDPR